MIHDVVVEFLIFQTARMTTGNSALVTVGRELAYLLSHIYFVYHHGVYFEWTIVKFVLRLQLNGQISLHAPLQSEHRRFLASSWFLLSTTCPPIQLLARTDRSSIHAGNERRISDAHLVISRYESKSAFNNTISRAKNKNPCMYYIYIYI